MSTDVLQRASDADRETAAGLLAEHLAAGRLTLAEYDDRVTAAYAATTVDELTPLLQDLPAKPRPVHQPSTPSLRPVWRSWVVTTVICLTIWAVTSIAARDVEGFWPFWVFGPWGVVLLHRTVRPLRASRCV